MDTSPEIRGDPTVMVPADADADADALKAVAATNPSLDSVLI
jgi:hypothetical protein